MPKISMTGTRKEHKLSQVQLENFKNLMQQYKDQGYTHLNHGDAIGADAIAHDMAVELGLEIIIHPPDNPKYRANCRTGNVTIRPEDKYKVRNQTIIDNGDVLIALPNTNHEYNRSGTWQCVRQGRVTGIPIVICYPDGRGVQENFNQNKSGR